VEGRKKTRKIGKRIMCREVTAVRRGYSPGGKKRRGAVDKGDKFETDGFIDNIHSANWERSMQYDLFLLTNVEGGKVKGPRKWEVSMSETKALRAKRF